MSTGIAFRNKIGHLLQ